MLGRSINVLFVILWCALGFGALRFAFGRFLARRGGPEIAALAVIAAFVAGAYWPFSERARHDRSLSAGAASGPAAVPQAPASAMRVASVPCAANGRPRDGGVGSFDVVRPAGEGAAALANGATVLARDGLTMLGWSAEVGATAPSSGACLVVDGRVLPGARVHYGGPRPDVAAAYRRDALLDTAFEIDIAAGSLARGTHELRVASHSANGEMRLVSGAHVVNVR